jgi:hypothetical protein
VDREKLNVLVSYAMFKGDRALGALRPDWSVMLDSGAFTNFTTGRNVVKLEDYCDFLCSHGSKFAHYIALDVIGDKAASERNFLAMKARGLTPVPVFQRGGATAESLVALLQANELVCIGGISQNLGSAAEQNYIRSVMDIVRTVPSAKVHLLGVGTREASTYNPYSADSSSWASAARFGNTKLYAGGTWVQLTKYHAHRTSTSYIKPDVAKSRILASYGLTWEQLSSADGWRPFGPVEVASIRAWIRFARDLRRKGCRYVLAINGGRIPVFETAWELEKQNWGW